MATINSNLITALNTVNTAPETLGAIGITNMSMFVEGTFAITTGLAANDIINLLPASLVPVGSIVDVENSFLFCETTPGTSVIVDIGTAANDDGIADALTLATGPAAGVVPFSKCGTLVAAQAKIETQAAIFATVKTATSPANCTVRFRVAFKARI